MSVQGRFTVGLAGVGLILVMSAGCAAPWLRNLDVETFGRYRVDVPDNYNTLSPADPNVVAATIEESGVVSLMRKEMVAKPSYESSDLSWVSSQADLPANRNLLSSSKGKRLYRPILHVP